MKANQNSGRGRWSAVLSWLSLLAGLSLVFIWTTHAHAGYQSRYTTYNQRNDPDYRYNGTNDGPVRLARFSYVNGGVSWRRCDRDDWATAALNMPIRQGAEIWVPEGSRAELQFDDGSRMRLG